MAAPGPASSSSSSNSSSLFLRLTNAWRLLSLRSDIDSIVLELLGTFSLEKIYSEGDQETYQHLVINLIAQLTTIFHIQRLSLPSDKLQVGWYLGFLVSWEVTLRTVEFVLQIVVEGRESLWDVAVLRDKYLAEFLLSALRVLTLHPKAPTVQRAKDRRDRFARIHRSLERVFDSYGGDKSFLLMVCKEVTDSLRSEPDSLGLPPGMKHGMPNLASELYPLADCLSSQYVSTIVTPSPYSSEWLPQFLALRDISNFVVGASVQYVVNGETRDIRLQASSARTRNAVLHALENMRIPGHLSKADLISSFSETFRIVLPETPSLVRRISSSSHMDERETDAIDALCVRLGDRQVLSRMSDREMMHSMSEVTKKIAHVDDPSGLFRASRPRLYTVNCGNCHTFGDSHLKNLGYIKFPSDKDENCSIRMPPNSTCATCGESVSIMREVTVFRQVWELLKPLEPNADTINVERHLPTQFQLSPPKVETGMLFSSSYSNILSSGDRLQDTGPASPRHRSPEQLRSIPHPLLSPVSPTFRQMSDASHVDASDAGNAKDPLTSGPQRSDSGKSRPPFSPGMVSSPGPSHARFEPSVSSVSFEPVPPSRSRTIPLVTPPEKGRSKWRPKFGSRKESAGASADTSSLSSTTLEGQRLEEISLKELTNVTKKSTRGKGSKNISVSLSQNSSYALFWTHSSIYIWDIGISPPILGRAIATESTCVLVAVTRVHLAYIIGTRDQKLTLRIVNLIQPSVHVVEYRMPSSLWCRSIAICPRENYVVVGFDNSIVRFFSTNNSEGPREDHLHSRYHTECKDCQPVDTLSFSNDGLVLLAGTRSPKSGMIQVFSWRFPFTSFEEILSCRYQVPLHESEDAGLSSAIYRSGSGGDDDLICITSWTQSGVPILVQPRDGHRTDIRTEISNRQSRLGNRIQTAAFSPSGRELAIVNDKGDLYKISRLNSSPLDIKKGAVSKELTAKSESFAMSFMTLPDEEVIILAWVDPAKGLGYIKKIPTVTASGPFTPSTPNLNTVFNQVPLAIPESPKYELPADSKEPSPSPLPEPNESPEPDEPPEPAELVSPDSPATFRTVRGLGLSKHT
ncbi:WD domain-containing protein [Amylocarpus encephaloides]|uniref:WD domain-containing protein n=1 Tax=Amylocarpus encephaloides TaxID=45428 RepID=A0A9P8C4K4_9HELO|nr:WD domain-containing protein [Amylocarpus encephaloides]